MDSILLLALIVLLLMIAVAASSKSQTSVQGTKWAALESAKAERCPHCTKILGHNIQVDTGTGTQVRYSAGLGATSDAAESCPFCNKRIRRSNP